MSNNEVTRTEHDPDDVVMQDADDEDSSPDYNADDDSGTDGSSGTDGDSEIDDDSGTDGNAEEEQNPGARAGQEIPRPPSPTNIAPWGQNIIAGARHRTHYPDYFPRIIRRLIGLIPYQDNLIGQNIRPVVVDVIRTIFSPTTLEEIAGLLSLAPTPLLKEIALAIATVVRACWEGPMDSSILLRALVPEGFMVSLTEWVRNLEDHQFPGE